jgi:hypothetical protein
MSKNQVEIMWAARIPGASEPEIMRVRPTIVSFPDVGGQVSRAAVIALIEVQSNSVTSFSPAAC